MSDEFEKQLRRLERFQKWHRFFMSKNEKLRKAMEELRDKFLVLGEDGKYHPRYGPPNP